MKKKLTQRDLEDALNRLKLLKFFPSDAGSQAALQELLARMCPHREALEWLVRTLLDRVGEWPGAMEIRGLLCTRYDAADGVDAYCSIPGFRPQDGEARAYEQHQQLKAGSWEADELVKQLAASHDLKQITGSKPN